MDSLITDAAHALSAGDPLGALKRVALGGAYNSYDEAESGGWTVISVKNDWKCIFTFDSKQVGDGWRNRDGRPSAGCTNPLIPTMTSKERAGRRWSRLRRS